MVIICEYDIVKIVVNTVYLSVSASTIAVSPILTAPLCLSATRLSAHLISDVQGYNWCVTAFWVKDLYRALRFIGN